MGNTSRVRVGVHTYVCVHMSMCVSVHMHVPGRALLSVDMDGWPFQGLQRGPWCHYYEEGGVSP